MSKSTIHSPFMGSVETGGGHAIITNNVQYNPVGDPNTNFKFNIGMAPSESGGVARQEDYMKNGNEIVKQVQSNYGSSYGQRGASIGKSTVETGGGHTTITNNV